MKLILPVLFAIILLCVYLFTPAQEQPTDHPALSAVEPATPIQPAPLKDLSITNAPEQASTENTQPGMATTPEQQKADNTEPESQELASDETQNELTFKLDQSTHFLILGSSDAEQGEMNFKSELLPSNEVKLSIQLQQQENDKIELNAYFDLANFTMELDGGNSVLNKEHKKLLKESGEALQSAIWEQYADYDIPEHALMLAQMMAYWSVSPEGFVHEKRVIVSQ